MELQSPTSTKNSVKETKLTWSTYATVWASIEPLVGKEAEVARQLVATATHKIRIRYYAGVLATHRIKFGSRIFHIAPPINPEERNIELIIIATEVV